MPTPLPNIGKSGQSPPGYSTSVKIEGQPVAIRGATFGSIGDVASKGTGGGIVSMNVEGPTKFIAPGSMDVHVEGKNVQLLGDQMLNNCGPSGSPANAATMVGELQAPAPGMPPTDPKCQTIGEIIDALINTVRPPTRPGGFPQRQQRLATRWRELAENRGNWGPGKKFETSFVSTSGGCRSMMMRRSLRTWPISSTGCWREFFKMPGALGLHRCGPSSTIAFPPAVRNPGGESGTPSCVGLRNTIHPRRWYESIAARWTRPRK